jgi:hypothetical protein
MLIGQETDPAKVQEAMQALLTEEAGAGAPEAADGEGPYAHDYYH